VLVRPDQPLDYAGNADFAYQHASGEWLSHFGDDDQLLPSRFRLLDSIISQMDAEMIVGSRLRYFWPSFLDSHLANSLDPAAFNDIVLTASGPEMARRMINSANVRHTASVVVHRDLIQRVRKLLGGRWMPDRLGEYVSYRVAAGLTNTVAFVNRPLCIIGRHNKSIGTSMHHAQSSGENYGVDLIRDIGARHSGTGYDFVGQQPFSFEAALLSASALQKIIGDCPIDFINWQGRVRADLAAQVTRGVVSEEEAKAIRLRGDAFLSAEIAKQKIFELPTGLPVACEPTWGWRTRLPGFNLTVGSISDVATWFGTVFEMRQGRQLKFESPDQTAVQWIDA